MTAQGLYNRWKKAAYDEQKCFSILCKMDSSDIGYTELKKEWVRLGKLSDICKSDYDQSQ